MIAHDDTMANRAPVCLICGEGLTVRLARGRKSNKPFVMLICPADGRHFRAFINDQAYVRQLLDRLEGQTRAKHDGDDANLSQKPLNRAGANLERGTGQR